MSLFWNQDREADIGLMMRSSGKSLDNAIVRLDNQWTAVNNLSDGDLLNMTSTDVASYSGLDVSVLNSMIERSLKEWRINPARSFINVVANLANCSAGEPMFEDLLKQTLVLTGLFRAGDEAGGKIGPIPDPNNKGRHHRSGGSCTLTVRSEHEAWINGIARSVRVWEMRNAAMVRAGNVKLPKRLFRGVRTGNLKAKINVEQNGRPFEHYSAEITQKRLEYLTSTPVKDVFFSPILSFTANEDIARYFTNGEGFVIGLDPRDVDIVSSFKLDAALDTKDPVNRKHEREWIVRLPPKTIIPAADVEVYHRDWLMVRGDYRGVELAGHSSFARYEIGGRKVEAHWVYKASGVGGSVKFQLNGDWLQYSRTEARKLLGFDPVPSSQDDVSNLEFIRYQRHVRNSERPINLVEEPGNVLSLKT